MVFFEIVPQHLQQRDWALHRWHQELSHRDDAWLNTEGLGRRVLPSLLHLQIRHRHQGKQQQEQ
jgi:hypothetical protein